MDTLAPGHGCVLHRLHAVTVGPGDLLSSSLLCLALLLGWAERQGVWLSQRGLTERQLVWLSQHVVMQGLQDPGCLDTSKIILHPAP